jgi:hypothetical protein
MTTPAELAAAIDPERYLTRAVQVACDVLIFHPECPPMPDGIEGLAAAMRDALVAAGFHTTDMCQASPSHHEHSHAGSNTRETR